MYYIKHVKYLAEFDFLKKCSFDVAHSLLMYVPISYHIPMHTLLSGICFLPKMLNSIQGQINYVYSIYI